MLVRMTLTTRIPPSPKPARAGSHCAQPPFRVLALSLLNGHQRCAKSTGLRANVTVSNLVLTTARANEGADAREHGCRAAERGLAALHPIQRLFHTDIALLDLHAIFTRHRQQRIASHAMQEAGV